MDISIASRFKKYSLSHVIIFHFTGFVYDKKNKCSLQETEWFPSFCAAHCQVPIGLHFHTNKPEETHLTLTAAG
jgi:hypothetical protein